MHFETGHDIPLPEKLIRDFAASVDRLLVIEELDPIIEDHCRRLGLPVHGKDTLPLVGEFSQGLLAKAVGRSVPESVSLPDEIPARPPGYVCGLSAPRHLLYPVEKQMYGIRRYWLLHSGHYGAAVGYGLKCLHGGLLFGAARV